MYGVGRGGLSGKKPGGRNHGQDCAFQVMKQVRLEGKCLKQKLGCIDKCCSHGVVLERVDSHGVVLKQAFGHIDKVGVSRFAHDGTYQHVVSSLLGNVASGSINQIHTERSTQPPSCKVATGPSAPVVLPPLDGDDDDDDNNHNYLDRQHRY